MTTAPAPVWRNLTPAQVHQLTARLSAAVAQAEALQVIVPAYAWEANAYRQVLAMIREA